MVKNMHFHMQLKRNKVYIFFIKEVLEHHPCLEVNFVLWTAEAIAQNTKINNGDSTKNNKEHTKN